MGTLDGKAALVTGGSRGIGAAIAHRLAAEGADVAITYERSAERAKTVVDAITGLGRTALALRADAADAAAVAAAVDRAAAALGGLDVLVNNAGVFPVGPVADLPLVEFDRAFAVNVRAVFVATQAALRHLRPGGRVVHIGSNLGERVPRPALSAYAATKAAVAGLSRGFARDLGPRGIASVVVAPGPTDTDMNPADGPRAADVLALSAVGRHADPADVAATVAHVAGPAGAFLTGSVVTVDGGVNA
ncbi:NAD(P)-dependent dehydrogenase, short-chain alcohol dehydrogenase family [Pseudonocardia thermophila]|jgi:Dehydrogenases with different specificities (related to short-chain alcohol dehydrogenases)|uniref:NAD(P)-dependent dehydrogenase, short-chain alcohol dehydrogenase family n=1 Tax=Pseudonocardia thermophila TaxID=1848 RepID=A0A1M6TMM7_PSETH|nr:SDR family NAD(P)-dependent oxidoreductase [Pseudonocardia thermophila]SHK58163.1 NAD(P)-dependent dehydrogenase, short-chain alcohol dehydrogenase family [Pseudonocardia thermophila]